MLRRSIEPSQYTSLAYTDRLADAGIAPSVGSKGDAYDNAMAESLNGTYKWELVKTRRWKSRSELELATVEWISWYNHTRLHGEIGDVSPAEFEAEWRARTAEPMLARPNRDDCTQPGGTQCATETESLERVSIPPAGNEFGHRIASSLTAGSTVEETSGFGQLAAGIGYVLNTKLASVCSACQSTHAVRADRDLDDKLPL